MPAEDSNQGSVFDQIRSHHGRAVDQEVRKLRWRFTTLRNDYRALIDAHDSDVDFDSEREQQLQSQGYVFEVERLLHHYLSGLFSLTSQQEQLQNSIGSSYRSELGQVRGNYFAEETSLTVLGMRHYVQHENILPLKPRVSKLEQTSSLILMVEDLHRQGDDQDFDSHFGHIDKPYLDPVEWIIADWIHVEKFFENTISVIEEKSSDEISEVDRLRDEADSLYGELAQHFQEIHRENDYE